MRATRGLAPGGGVTVGIHPRESRTTYPDGQTVAEVATWHALGAGRLPVRDPVGQWWDRTGRRDVLRATRAALTRSLRSGRPPWGELDRAGRAFATAVRAEFQRLRPLAPSTIRGKGHARILYRTGRLWSAIGYRVRRGRGRDPG